ncbi:uncharacterized protein LOC121757273 [Salvia splendens]|uniref:uncharacterized protein LOC121757273 n=1 Tax=Salvia splendens TaxID=180675 RepID=UPI001C25CE37|nr:uncharacterized protein LOC121757273 [Salvia splendens]XP_042008742.1 uncharacterized protein LOC121757273 [Salvia splendens]
MTENVKREDKEEEWVDFYIRVKFVTNKEKTKVLFAEAGSDFADALLTFLLIPLGTIVKFVNKYYKDKAPVIGSLSTLYNALENLDDIHFPNKDAKTLLLNPKGLLSKHDWPDYDPGFTESTASFVISDDLRVMGSVESSVMSTLTSLGIGLVDMDGAETRDVTFGFRKILKLLIFSLVYRNPLTAFLLGGHAYGVAASRAEQGNIVNQIGKRTHSINSKKMILKAMMQKSTNMLLFAQAQHDFVSFLFGLLSIPLGKVEWYLHSDTGFRAIDNLHRSIPDSLFRTSLMDLEDRNMLFKPSLSNDDDSDDDSTSKGTPSHHRQTGYGFSNEYIPLNFDPSENQFHVRGSRVYMVSDDLTITPLSIMSSVFVINEMKVPLSDVEEVELQVGLEEGLSILRAALTSTKALSDGLLKPILKKKGNQQK